jgi:hypothetical protein
LIFAERGVGLRERGDKRLMGKMQYFYYTDKGEKRGGFSGKEMKALAKSGLINPDTVIETEEGKKYYARGIGGVEFGSSEKEDSTLEPIEVRAIPMPTVANASTKDSQDSNITIPDSTSLLYYYDRMGAQRGPYTIKSIRARAQSGAIKPDTVIELEGSRRLSAKEIGGIEFEEAEPLSVPQDMELVALRLRLLELENKMVVANQQKKKPDGRQSVKSRNKIGVCNSLRLLCRTPCPSSGMGYRFFDFFGTR